MRYGGYDSSEEFNSSPYVRLVKLTNQRALFLIIKVRVKTRPKCDAARSRRTRAINRTCRPRPWPRHMAADRTRRRGTFHSIRATRPGSNVA